MGFGKGLSAGSIVGGIVLLVLAFSVFATGLPLIQNASQSVADTGAPLTSFFGSNGLIILALVAGILLSVIGYIGIGSGKR